MKNALRVACCFSVGMLVSNFSFACEKSESKYVPIVNLESQTAKRLAKFAGEYVSSNAKAWHTEKHVLIVRLEQGSPFLVYACYISQKELSYCLQEHVELPLGMFSIGKVAVLLYGTMVNKYFSYSKVQDNIDWLHRGKVIDSNGNELFPVVEPFVSVFRMTDSAFDRIGYVSYDPTSCDVIGIPIKN